MSKYLLRLQIVMIPVHEEKLEKAPFSLDQVWALSLVFDDKPNEVANEPSIPILSSDTQKAMFQNTYYKRQMELFKIKLREIGHVRFGKFQMAKAPNKAVAKNTDSEPFPFQLTDTQTVISYLEKNKNRYVNVSGIRQIHRFMGRTLPSKTAIEQGMNRLPCFATPS